MGHVCIVVGYMNLYIASHLLTVSLIKSWILIFIR